MATTHDIVQKLWSFCDILRDDGITYHQYVTELTYILFLKMAKETDTEENNIPEGYRWDDLIELEGLELKKYYQKLLLDLASEGSTIVQQIYSGAHTNIDEPRNLEKLIKECKPRIIVVDNLNILDKDNRGKYFEDLYKNGSKLGADIIIFILNTAASDTENHIWEYVPHLQYNFRQIGFGYPGHFP